MLTMPAVAALRHAYPRAHLTLLVNPELKALLNGLPGLDEVIEYRADQRSWWIEALALGSAWRREHFDLVVIANPKKVFHAAAYLAGIPQRVGYDRKWGWCLTHRLADRKALGERHEVEYNLELVDSLGFSTSMPRWQLPPLEPEHTEILRLLEHQGIHPSESVIALHPWTSNPLKRWPLERFEAVARAIVASRPVKLVVIGGSEEVEVARTVVARDWPVVNLVGQLTLRHLAALLQRTQVLVSNDSGPVHLAAAVQAKTVVLFGTSDPAAGPRRWGPWGSGHVVIWKPSVEAIIVDEVVAAVRRQLSS